MSEEKEEAFCLGICDKAEEMLNPEKGSGASSGPEQGGQQQRGLPQGAPQLPREHSPISQDRSELSQPQGPLPAAVTPQPQTKQLEPAGAAEDGASFEPGSGLGQPCSQSPPSDVQELLRTIPPVPHEAVVKQKIPRKLWKVGMLRHRKKVHAVAVSGSTHNVYTCGSGYIRVWDESSLHSWDKTPRAQLDLQDPQSRVLVCKLTPDEQSLVTAGRSRTLTLWDLAPTPRVRAELPSTGSVCYSLAISTDARICLASFRGFVEVWDLQNQQLIRSQAVPMCGSRCIDITSTKFWTGGEDTKLYSWDLRSYEKLQQYSLQYEILSITHDPSEEWVLAGLGNGEIITVHTQRKEHFKVVGLECSSQHNLKFAASGSCFVDTVDDYIRCIEVPSLRRLFQVQEPSEILCCDLSSDGQYLVTGCKNGATVYQLLY